MPVYRITVILLICTLGLFNAGCSGTAPGMEEVSDEQKEKDLIELINARQVKPPDMMTELEKETANQQISDLQKRNEEIEAELQRLREQVFLKDEKIRQLESGKDQPGKTTEAPPAAKSPVEISDYARTYQAALDEFMGRRYGNSLTMFRNLLEKDRQHLLADNCQYWIGECHFALRDYRKAIISFEKVFTYMKSNKDDDAQMKLGVCYYRINDNKRASEELTKLINSYPKSEYVGRARTLLAKIQ